MRRLFTHVSMLCLIWLTAYQSPNHRSSTMVTPTFLPLAPTINTLYYSEQALPNLPSDVLQVSRLEEFNYYANDQQILLIYLDQTTIDVVDSTMLTTRYRQGTLIAAIDVPLTMLGKKVNHQAKIDSHEFFKQKTYVSALITTAYRDSSNHQGSTNELNTPIQDFTELHRHLKAMWSNAYCPSTLDHVPSKQCL